MKKLILMLILLPLVFAQYSSEEWTLSILSLIFGELPSVCSSSISPTCVKCIGAVKLVPFIFFISIFFFVFYFVFLQTLGREEVSAGPVTEKKIAEIPSTARKVAILISLALSIAILHYQPITTSLKQVLFWAAIGFILSAFLVGLATFRTGGVVFPGIIFLIIIIGMFGYIWSYISPQIEEWESLCL
ncbi:MAG: hypothetical protein QXJ14_00910 [Candidatus Aenigmatarchaeota archaeon]